MYTAINSGANMDTAESDDSERWEDFYGSSTDLTPALIRIYDSLNTALEAKYKTKSTNGSITKAQQHTKENQQLEDISPMGSNCSLKRSSPLNRSPARNGHYSVDLSSGSNNSINSKQRNNIRFLSPNVQRLITHADADHVVDTIDVTTLNQSPEREDHQDEQSETTTANSSPRFVKKSISHHISHHGHRSKLSHIPLSKVTCQLTAAGNELVSTFDSSGEYINALSPTQHVTNTAQQQTLALEPSATDDDDDNDEDDSEKTPTNGAKTFAYDFRVLPQRQQSIQFMEIGKLATTTQLLSSLTVQRSHTQLSDHASDNEELAEHAQTNFSENDDEINGIMEAINTSLVNMQQVLNFNKANNKSCDTISDTASRDKSEIGSTESLDRPTEMKFNAQKSYALMLPEIAKLKHRPLSSSSLCSTSSSSSSGSDNLNSKLNLNMSYLASVESLADHSEPDSGLTVLERSCLEIFESERNYVEDLRQVITGYLSDWKERACLRIDELQTLFSNIEEIYELSSRLLNLLGETGMEPIKIAKCFISMSDQFEVYTKYCTSYPEAISLLTKLLQATHTNSLLASTQKRLQHTLPLGSYLLKPVQRILKYHLLLDNLRKHCDVKEVTQAYEIMRQVARHIDQVKRRLEQQSRVKELSGILDGWLGPELTVLGELRYEGLLMEHNKPRIVLLFATMLIITKPKEDNRLIFKSLINQNNLMLTEHLPGEPTSFYVIPYDNPRNQIKLTAKNREQKRVWTQRIKEAMLERFGNIPNRAKELVFQLGDEEERSTEKITRKWTINSVTPTYLERRNQYRRSELRKRSKLKRKTVADLSTIEAEVEKEAEELAAVAPTKPLRRNNSIDDSMVPRLLRLATSVRHRNAPQQPPTHAVSQEMLDIDAEENDDEATKRLSKSTAAKAARERSKSVPKINLRDEDLDKLTTTETAPKPKQAIKTVPKRAPNAKKLKNTTKRDTFKFYMDISEFDQSDEQTVLKITESLENVSKTKVDEIATVAIEDEVNSENKQNEPQVVVDLDLSKTAKKDAQIVQELLKESKEFERIYKKSQRKRSTEARENDIAKNILTRERAPTPPSSSPPLDADVVDIKELKSTTEAGVEPHNDEVDEVVEPIYESLLRNVHVPYKFSTDFKRSKSLQSYTRRKKKSLPLPPRPESDYVMLKYTAEGSLQQVGQDRISTDSTMSQKTLCADEEMLPEVEAIAEELPTKEQAAIEIPPSPVQTPTNAKPMNLMRRLFVSQNSSSHSHSNGRMSSLENISNALLSRKTRRKSIDNYGCSNKLPERRASDVTEMCRLSILHRQGSQAVGERMASAEYADPRLLFTSSLPFNQQLLRDSVVSLTSSNDSVHGPSSNRFTNGGGGGKYSSTELATNFEYEDDVEASLEQNFRDSAIYSDNDNERRPAEAKVGASKKNRKSGVGTPPQLPPKPPNLKSLIATTPPGVIVCPANMNKTASRSWVLQQIENFSK